MCLYRYLDMFICLDIYIYGFIPAGGGARGRGGGHFDSVLSNPYIL